MNAPQGRDAMNPRQGRDAMNPRQGRDALLEALRAVDTPTLSNAIERLEVRSPIMGFGNRLLRSLTPELGVMCGYAVTAEVQTMSAETKAGLDEPFVQLCEALERTPSPSIVVLRECGPFPEFSAHCGEVMATIFSRLGAVGLVSDSAVRDLAEVRALGFHYFAPGTVASHGSFRVVRVQVPLAVCGLQVAPGDLLHGDLNGLIMVPASGRERLPELVKEVRKTEAALMDFVKADAFSTRALRDRLTR